MITEILRKLRKSVSKKRRRIDPDEIFLDSSNLPNYNKDQFEGRIEKAIGKRSLTLVSFFFLLIIIAFITKASFLQIRDGKIYADKSANNHLKKDVIFADRGTITDRNGKELAWNEISGDDSFPKRKYITTDGFSNLLGFIKYPQKDSSGFFYTNKSSGQDGLEKYFDTELSGKNGVKLTEVDVKGKVQSESTVEPPQNGKTLTLSIDSGLQEAMYNSIANAVETSGFVGGAGVYMDAKTGEVISLVTYPGYDSEILTEGQDKKAITNIFQNKRNLSLDRAINGLYAPGSTVKPFIATGVLSEHIIDPMQNILSTGSISLPNPYDPAHPSIFKDWKAHGYVDMRHAIAVSSDVYFYEVGGGFGNLKGLGISKIDEYLEKFLFASSTEGFFAGPKGIIPTEQWKKDNFKDGVWRVGDTYHTTIGQYGFQATPLQLARAVTGIANNGKIVSPTIIKGQQGQINNIEGISQSDFQIVKEGMRLAVTDATAIALNIPGLSVAAKTGTSEIGTEKVLVNSSVEGFLPWNNPKYVFYLILERGPGNYKVSSMRAMAAVLNWAKENAPEYVGLATSTSVVN